MILTLKKNIFYIPFFLFFLLAFVSCQRSHPENPKTITVGVEAYPENLDPRFSVDALSSKVNRLLYNGLFKLNEKLEVVFDLAEEVHQPSETVFEIKLRDNVFFHNGKKLTAHDVWATYQSILDPKTRSPQRSVFEKMKKMEVINENTLRLELKEPFAPIFTSLTLGILPQELAALNSKVGVGSKNGIPIGTGPYRFVEARHREKIVLERNDRYFGSKAKNETLIFRSIYDDTLRTLEMIQGRLDIVQNAIPYVLISAIQKRKNLNFTTAPGINFSYMGFNLTDPILKNLAVRQAIAMAINRKEIIKYKLKNLATPATSLLFPGHWAHHSQLEPIQYNPQKARELLNAVGFVDPDGDGPKMRFELIYKTSTKKDRVQLALLIAEQLKQIGIDVKVKPYEWGTFFRDVRMGNFQLYSLTWVGLTEPDIYFFAFHSSMLPPDGANRNHYINAQLDDLVEKGRGTIDRSQRKVIYEKIQEIIFRDLPYVPLWYEQNWLVTKKNVKGYSLRPDAGFQNLVKAYKVEKPKNEARSMKHD